MISKLIDYTKPKKKPTFVKKTKNYETFPKYCKF